MLEAHDYWLAWSGAALGRAEGYLGWAAYDRATGDYERAFEQMTAALACAANPRQPLALLAAHRYLGEVPTDRGCFDEAGTHLRVALALAEACAPPYERAQTLFTMANLRHASGEMAAARALFADVHAICTPLCAKPILAQIDALALKIGTAGIAAPGALEAVIEGAGLRAIERGDVACPFVYPNADLAWRGGALSGVVQRAIETSGEERVRAAIAEVDARFTRPDGSVRYDNVFI